MIRTQNKKLTVLSFILDNLCTVLLILIVTIGAIFANSFFTLSNMVNFLRQNCINASLAIGFTFVILIDGFDLSQGSIMSIAAILMASVLNITENIILAIVVALGAGMLFGSFTGYVIKKIKGDFSDSYLITLGTSMIALGFSYVYTGGYQIVLIETLSSFRDITRADFLGLPAIALFTCVLMLLAHFILKRTTFGRSFYIVGGNKTAAYMSGIKAHNIKMYAFVISGLCAGIGAILMVSRTGSINPTGGVGYEFDAACATLIGGNKAGDGSSGIQKTVIGVLLLGFISNVMNLLNYGTVEQQIVKGIIMLIALLANRFKPGILGGNRK